MCSVFHLKDTSGHLWQRRGSAICADVADLVFESLRHDASSDTASYKMQKTSMDEKVISVNAPLSSPNTWYCCSDPDLTIKTQMCKCSRYNPTPQLIAAKANITRVARGGFLTIYVNHFPLNSKVRKSPIKQKCAPINICPKGNDPVLTLCVWLRINN